MFIKNVGRLSLMNNFGMWMWIYKYKRPLISASDDNLLYGQLFLGKYDVIIVTNDIPYSHLHTSFFGF